MNFAQFFPTVVGIKQFNEDLQPMISKCYKLYETIPNTGDKFISKKRYTTHNAVNLNEIRNMFQIILIKKINFDLVGGNGQFPGWLMVLKHA